MRVLKAVRVDILIFVRSFIAMMSLDIGCGEGSFESLVGRGVRQAGGYSVCER